MKARVAPALRRRLQQIAGWLVGAACLVWLLHDTRVSDMAAGVRSLDWDLVALAVAVDVASYGVQGLRWKLLLRPLGDARWIDAVRAIYAGLFASEILPMRPGEVVRAYIMARTIGSGVTRVAPSIIVERLFDGLWLTAGLGLMAMIVPLPRNLAESADVLGAFVLLAAGGLLYAVLRMEARPDVATAPARDRWPPGRLPNAARRALQHVADGLRRIGLGRRTWLAFGLSLVLLAGQVVAFWLVMRACGLRLSFWSGAAVLFIIHLGTAVPNAPANVGTYQFFAVVGLSLFGIDKASATAFSMVVFVALTVPLWLLGYVALARTQMSLGTLRAAAERVRLE